MLCTAGTFDALITGDMNTAVEGRLVKYGNLPDVEVLIAGHHGSRYASSQPPLETITPEYALLSVDIIPMDIRRLRHCSAWTRRGVRSTAPTGWDGSPSMRAGKI